METDEEAWFLPGQPTSTVAAVSTHPAQTPNRATFKAPLPTMNTPTPSNRKEKNKRNKETRDAESDHHSLESDNDADNDNTNRRNTVESTRESTRGSGHWTNLLKTQNAHLESELNSKIHEIAELKQSLDSLREEVRQLANRLTSVEAATQPGNDLGTARADLPNPIPPVKLNSDVVRSAVREICAIERKQQNIVISGLHEPTDDEEAYQRDLSLVADIFKEIGRDTRDIKTFRRLKRKPPHSQSGEQPIAASRPSPRPIVLTLTNSVQRNRVLYAARKLVNSRNFSKVYLNPDLTKEERDEEKAKRIERNTKNEDAIKENLPFRYILRRGQVTQIPAEEYRAPGSRQ